MNSPTDPTPADSPIEDALDSRIEEIPDDFFERNKFAIIASLAGIVVLIFGFGAYQIAAESKKQREQAAFMQASTAEELRDFIETKPHSVLRGNAELLLANQLIDEGAPDSAVQLLESFLERTPNHPMAPVAMLSLAAIEEARQNLAAAADGYARVAATFSDGFAGPYAMLAQAQVLALDGQSARAGEVYRTVRSEFAGTIAAQIAEARARELSDESEPDRAD